MTKAFWKQTFFFSIIGALLAVFDLGVYVLLTTLIPWCKDHYIVTSVFTSGFAITISFLANRRWTFAHTTSGVEHYVRYVIVYALAVLWQNILLFLFVSHSFPLWLAKAVAIVIVAYGWNFLLVKFWVFRYNTPTSA